MLNKTVTTVDEWKNIASEIINSIDVNGEGTITIALSGDLGTGKTTLVQQIAVLLGVTEPVTSPTFNILKRYETTDQKFSTLMHMDAYRLDSDEELIPLRFTELLQEPKTLFCIEWAEKIKKSLPQDTIYFHLEIDKDNQHTIQRVS